MSIMREVHICPVLNGFIVSVGCQRLVFSTIEAVAVALIEYQKNPTATEEKFLAEAVNMELPMPTPCAEAQDQGKTLRGYSTNPRPRDYQP